MQTLFHGSRVIVEHPEVRTHKYYKDFGWGFYCTMLEPQAVRWATKFGMTGIVNKYSYTENIDLNVKKFPELSDEWLDFVASCRNGKSHDYDVVEGPMADDTIFNYVQEFIDGSISREAFWALARFKYPTHQISFHTKKALLALKFEGSYEVHV